jgi:hypothetical protein
MPAAVVDMMAGLGCTAGSLGKDGLRILDQARRWIERRGGDSEHGLGDPVLPSFFSALFFLSLLAEAFFFSFPVLLSLILLFSFLSLQRRWRVVRQRGGEA